MFSHSRHFAVLLIAVGVALAGYHGEQWLRLPKWSAAAEIEQSVELNLAIEIKRRGPHLQPTGERLERLRGMIRADVEGEIQRERRELERWMGAGLLLAILGAGQVILRYALPRQRKN